MSTNINQPNPFTPPQAAVSDVHLASEAFQDPPLISARGRIGRLRLFVYINTAYLLFYFVGVLLVLIGLGAVILPALQEGSSTGTLFSGLAGGAILILFVAGPLILLLGVYFILKLIQRSHDMGWSGWTVLLTFIPLVVLIWYFKKGDSGPNAYGPPPTPNGTGLKVGGALYGSVFALSLLMAVATLFIAAPQGEDPPSDEPAAEQPAESS